MSATDRQVGGNHYKKHRYQHWTWIYDISGLAYHIGCATKYVARHRDKNGIEDLEKALHYAEFILEKVKVGEPNPVLMHRHNETDLFVETTTEPNSLERSIIRHLSHWKDANHVETAIAKLKLLIQAESLRKG